MNEIKTSILTFFSLSCLGILFWKVFVFTHPYPNYYLNFIFFIQFIPVVFSYIISLKLGRIVLIVFALCGTRIINQALDPSIEIITNAPVFIGGLFGVFLRNVLMKFPSQPNNGLRNKDSEYMFLISILIFLIILGFNRFLIYYNYPYLNTLPIQELLFTPSLYSKQAFAYSVDLLSGLIFPLLYFIFEKQYFPSKIKIHYLHGIFWTLLIQSIVILIQYFYNINFLADHTNHAPTFQRVTGLFRDAGSASFIFPCMLLFFFREVLKRVKRKQYYFLFFLINGTILGLSQGRLYWLLWIFGAYLDKL
jgi:hypothetical protein